jgi:hypothetical protein
MELIMALVGTPQTGTPSIPATNEKEASNFKANKKAAADRHAAKVKEDRQKDHEFFLGIRDEIKALGNWDKLQKSSQEYITAKCVPPAERIGHSGPSFLTQVFGDSPTVGKSVTLKDVITNTYKGMDTMQASIKKWAAKGIDVKVEINKQDMLATKYTITAINPVKATAAE